MVPPSKNPPERTAESVSVGAVEASVGLEGAPGIQQSDQIRGKLQLELERVRGPTGFGQGKGHLPTEARRVVDRDRHGGLRGLDEQHRRRLRSAALQRRHAAPPGPSGRSGLEPLPEALNTTGSAAVPALAGTAPRAPAPATPITVAAITDRLKLLTSNPPGQTGGRSRNAPVSAASSKLGSRLAAGVATLSQICDTRELSRHAHS